MKGTYVSGDEVERAGTRKFGNTTVCQHPGEIGTLERDEVLVIDFGHVLFQDWDPAVTKASQTARGGMPVGVQTYHPEDPASRVCSPSRMSSWGRPTGVSWPRRLAHRASVWARLRHFSSTG